jgi:NAD(P)-dependent dehydrogenase (short-subunit alcohol dehydrogenase family)
VNDAIKQILGQYSNAKLEPLDADVSASTVAATIKKFPKLDILINNVGTGELKPFEKISDGDWFKLIETNFMSGVRLSRFYLPLMKKQGWGRILFISSESGVNIPSNSLQPKPRERIGGTVSSLVTVGNLCRNPNVTTTPALWRVGRGKQLKLKRMWRGSRAAKRQASTQKAHVLLDF